MKKNILFYMMVAIFAVSTKVYAIDEIKINPGIPNVETGDTEPMEKLHIPVELPLDKKTPEKEQNRTIAVVDGEKITEDMVREVIGKTVDENEIAMSIFAMAVTKSAIKQTEWQEGMDKKSTDQTKEDSGNMVVTLGQAVIFWNELIENSKKEVVKDMDEKKIQEDYDSRDQPQKWFDLTPDERSQIRKNMIEDKSMEMTCNMMKHAIKTIKIEWNKEMKPENWEEYYQIPPMCSH